MATKTKAAPARGAEKLKLEPIGLTVDCVVFGFDEGNLKVALIKRGTDPFKDKWALPGGFVQAGESLEDAARRVLSEETGIGRVFLEQLYTFGAPSRDPRGHVVSVAYYALVKLADHRVKSATDAADVAWHPAESLPSLAFDHKKIVQTALERLRGKLRYQPIGFELLPPKFKLSQLQHLYEAVLGRELDKRNFRRKVLSLGILEELDEVETGVAHRAARLYRFDKKAYQALIQSGFNFEI